MSCSANGSIRWPYQAWLRAPPRCFWSTGAREPDKAWVPKQKPPGSPPEALARSSQRFDFLAFFFFLTAFLAAFFTAFLADFFAEDFLAAFLAFLASFGIAFFAAFLTAFFAFLTAGLATSFGASTKLVASVIGSRTGFSSSISSPRVSRSDHDSGIRTRVKELLCARPGNHARSDPYQGCMRDACGRGSREPVYRSLSGDADRDGPDRSCLSRPRRQGFFHLGSRRHAGRDQASPRGPVLSALRGRHPGLRQRGARGDLPVGATLRRAVRTVLLCDLRADCAA